MYINNIKNIDRLIERLRGSYKKGEVLTNILKTSDYSSLEEVKKAMNLLILMRVEVLFLLIVK